VVHQGCALDHLDVPATDGTQAVAFNSWGWGNLAVLVNDPHVNPFDLQTYGTPAGLMKGADGAPVVGNVMVSASRRSNHTIWPWFIKTATIASGQL
jgi:hypothetical protein